MLRDFKIKFYKFWCEYFNKVGWYFFKKVNKPYYNYIIVTSNKPLKEIINNPYRENRLTRFYRLNYEMSLIGYGLCSNRLKRLRAN